ncbi:putative telomere length and silencing protein [Helianthus annuus]|nr:putative telomere length and silencing protein [Helianthus annuus]KAJ0783794.1 putative telomere length and silencing protein [Helianthus annuus]
MKKTKNFRKRSIAEVEDDHTEVPEDGNDMRLALEEIKFLQKLREKKSGVPAVVKTGQAAAAASGGNSAGGLVSKGGDKGDGDGEKDDLVLQDTFAQETAVMDEDPHMLKYIEQELAKKKGKNIDVTDQVENDIKHAEDELYKIPEHLKVKRRNSEESSTQWTTGIAEIQLPIEFKLKNIEETEAAKKLLQEKRLMGRAKTESTIPSSYSADYFQRGKDYAEKLRRDHPELYKNKGANNNGESKASDPAAVDGGDGGGGGGGGGGRQAATDQIMLDRFRKRERHRVTRR